MKLFVSLAVVCLFAGIWAVELTDEQKAKAKTHFEHCIKQENVPEEDANRMRKRDFTNPSDSMKCFSACFFEQVGVLKDNTVQEDIAKQKLSAILGEEKTNEVSSKCKDVKGDGRCETGYEIFKCLASLKAQILA